jgi:hypothetical protein
MKRDLETAVDAVELGQARAALTDAINSTLDPREMVARALAGMAEAMMAEVAILVAAREGSWAIEQVYGLPEAFAGTPLPVEEHRVVDAARRQARSFAVDRSGDFGHVLEIFGLSSAMLTPLLLRDRMPGLLILGRRSPRAFLRPLLEFADRMAFTLSLALENAELHEVEHHIAENLRDRLRPFVESTPGLEIGYAWQVAARLEDVGGDFLDVFVLRPGLAGLFLGDASGRGLAATGVVELVRGAVRSLAALERSPSAVLSQVNEALFGHGREDLLVAACYGCLDLQTLELTLSVAGHPPPAILTRQRAFFVDTPPGLPLGASRSTYTETVHTLMPDERLVLYTDGVTQARSGEEPFGESGLLRVLAENLEQDPQELADTVLSIVLDFSGGRREDDIVVAVLKPTVGRVS